MTSPFSGFDKNEPEHGIKTGSITKLGPHLAGEPDADARALHSVLIRKSIQRHGRGQSRKQKDQLGKQPGVGQTSGRAVFKLKYTINHKHPKHWCMSGVCHLLVPWKLGGTNTWICFQHARRTDRQRFTYFKNPHVHGRHTTPHAGGFLQGGRMRIRTPKDIPSAECPNQMQIAGFNPSGTRTCRAGPHPKKPQVLCRPTKSRSGGRHHLTGHPAQNHG